MDFRTVKDQVGRTVRIPKSPQRIISLVPSQTELLFGLDLGNRVVGITKFCVHPDEWFRSKARVGGTKKLNFESISALNPDLIIANKEENNHEDIKRLEVKHSVWVSDVNNLDTALEMINEIGEITCTEATNLIEEIKLAFSNITSTNPPLKALYLIWNNPYMAAGSDTFICDMMEKCGLQNLVKSQRYPELSLDQIIKLNPELILLSSEPFPFNKHHVSELQKVVPNSNIQLVDGEMFSWYGSRLLLAPKYLNSLTSMLR